MTTTEQAALLPVHELLVRLEAWRAAPSAATVVPLQDPIVRLARAYGARGAYLVVDAPPLPPLEISAGSMDTRPATDDPTPFSAVALRPGAAQTDAAWLWVDGPAESAARLGEALELALTAVWSRHEATLKRQHLEALDVAVRGIAGILSVDRVLQLIVDRVRELGAAEYAAMGIVGSFGHIEEFITSGVTREQRAEIGAPPQGRGLLGLLIREDEAILIEDIARDPRRHGFPPNHPQMTSFLGVPVRSKGRTIGNLYLANKLNAPRFSDADLQLVEMFALHAAIAIENARLHEEIQRLAIVEERQRISQDLHDSIIQSLYAISLSLEDLPDIITEDPPEGAARADRAIDSIHGTIRDIRNFIMGLQPELIEDGDLATGIETLAAEFQTHTMIDLEVSVDSELPALPREQAAHLLAITREALSNISRHSGATRASLVLSRNDGSLRLVVGDNGRGFDTGRARSASQRGLTNLRSRAEAIGGSFILVSEPGAGTRIEAVIPTDSEGTDAAKSR